MPRQNKPGSKRTDTRPLDDTVTLPAVLEADTPRRDTFNRVPRPTRMRFRRTNPTR